MRAPHRSLSLFLTAVMLALPVLAGAVTMMLMDIHFGTIIWTVFIFVVLMFVLGKFAERHGDVVAGPARRRPGPSALITATRRRLDRVEDLVDAVETVGLVTALEAVRGLATPVASFTGIGASDIVVAGEGEGLGRGPAFEVSGLEHALHPLKLRRRHRPLDGPDGPGQILLDRIRQPVGIGIDLFLFIRIKRRERDHFGINGIKRQDTDIHFRDH
mgnify:CR=1 FL=1